MQASREGDTSSQTGTRGVPSIVALPIMAFTTLAVVFAKGGKNENADHFSQIYVLDVFTTLKSSFKLILWTFPIEEKELGFNPIF